MLLLTIGQDSTVIAYIYLVILRLIKLSSYTGKGREGGNQGMKKEKFEKLMGYKNEKKNPRRLKNKKKLVVIESSHRKE